MRKQLCFILLIISQLIIGSDAYGDLDPKRYELPDSVKAINSISGLDPFLSSQNENIAIGALLDTGRSARHLIFRYFSIYTTASPSDNRKKCMVAASESNIFHCWL